MYDSGLPGLALLDFLPSLAFLAGAYFMTMLVRRERGQRPGFSGRIFQGRLETHLRDRTIENRSRF